MMRGMGLGVGFGVIAFAVASSMAADVEVEIDFSTCGYRHSAVPIPLVPVRAVVEADDREDDQPAIQAALDHVASLEPDANGFRGAVLLKGRQFILRRGLTLTASGVVLRGSDKGKTTVEGTDLSREPIVRVLGKSDLVPDDEDAYTVSNESVPAGARRLTLDSVEGLELGQRVLVHRPSTKEWIESIGMDREGIAWKPGTRDLVWERTLVSIEGNRIELDAPITMALEERFGGGVVVPFSWPGRIADVGIENLTLLSGSSGGADGGPLLESRPWHGITMENVEHAWVRQVDFMFFPGGAVALWESSKNVTVQDCVSVQPVSRGGYRHLTFFTMGQQTLFLRCWSEGGRHDFSAGHCAAGPNAFVQCHAQHAKAFSGPIESWVTGLLYDNVSIDGAGIHLENRWRTNNGVGWCAANCVIWQANAAEFRCFDPPGGVNRAVGTWGVPNGDGNFDHLDEFVKPRSLFKGQLAERLGGEDKVGHLEPVGRDYVGATNPSPAQAEAFVAASFAPAETLREIINKASEREPLWSEASPTGVPVIAEPMENGGDSPETRRSMSIEDGRLWVGGELLSGSRFTPIWWRGNTRPPEASSFGPALTRFVPGRMGRGFTDDLEEVADEMVREGVAVVEHHHGLWYDRRRDDHTRVRRADDGAVPPFYEQPFARSQNEGAWDGLDRYDLTTFNPWYWNRLQTFAELCEQRGLVLFNQHYFQHNLLEAGAHWTDFPWREANNINSTGFPEPPPYIGDKRIFQAHLFYDVSHEVRRRLHRGYIRKHLNAFADKPNVIHSVSAEFTGPLEFVRFWIDTIREWERETGKEAVVCLSCTKDVQDAILSDPARGEVVSVIDIRYWWYQPDGKLYAPLGGKHLAPRQHARQLRPKRASKESRERAVREYRERYPEKVIWVDGRP